MLVNVILTLLLEERIKASKYVVIPSGSHRPLMSSGNARLLTKHLLYGMILLYPFFRILPRIQTASHLKLSAKCAARMAVNTTVNTLE
jgi:hypothetical protein